MPDAVVNVFVTYSHADRGYLEDDSLLGYLKGLEKENVVFWTDRHIRVGEAWNEVIKANIQKAHIALVLVSQGFLDSDYCQNVEIRHLLAQKSHLFPIILSPCEWQRHEWLRRDHRGALHRLGPPQAAVSGDPTATSPTSRADLPDG
jgi:hypothetical protein